MKIFILAGGSGTRLWPLSRRNHPKQFLKLFGGKSLLQTTAERFKSVARPEDFVVITNKAYEFAVRSDLPWLEHIILEPVGRNTGPAIALAAQFAIDKLGSGADEVIFISPSDHLIEPVDRFAEYVRLSDTIAQTGHLVTFGIKPLTPETGYGYIKAATGRPVDAGSDKALGEAFNVEAYNIEAFVEKPDLATAQRYLAEGSYYWNSGMFAFTAAAMKEELSCHAPQIASSADLGYDGMMASFESMPSISIDYAVMEKSSRVAVIPADLNWNDVGSWDSAFDMAPDRLAGTTDNVVNIDSENTIVLGMSRIIAAIGLTDCVIVDTPDALLVAKKGHGQKVKQVVDRLIDGGRREATEHVTTTRPWGSFTNLLETDGFKVKRIIVNPGEKLSLQYHEHRSEHWVVVKGRAKVTIAAKEEFVGENASIYIPATTPHRLENQDVTPLEVIEVQYGDYLGEDDIVRMEDVYGRTS